MILTILSLTKLSLEISRIAKLVFAILPICKNAHLCKCPFARDPLVKLKFVRNLFAKMLLLDLESFRNRIFRKLGLFILDLFKINNFPLYAFSLSLLLNLLKIRYFENWILWKLDLIENLIFWKLDILIYPSTLSRYHFFLIFWKLNLLKIRSFEN